MKRKSFVIALIIMIVFAFSAMPAAAASKRVVMVSEKVYQINAEGEEELSHSAEDTYSDGRLTKRSNVWVNYQPNGEGDPTRVETSRITIYKYNTKTGQYKSVINKADGKNSTKTVYKYKNEKLQKTIDYNYVDGSFKKVSETTYKSTSKKSTRVTKYTNGDPDTKVVMTLDSKQRMTKSVEYKDGKVVGTTKNSYYDNGGLKKITYEAADGRISSLTKYNKKGLMTRSVQNYADGTLLDHTYKYDFNGLMTEDKIKQKISGSDGKLDTIEVTHTYKYSNWYGSTKKYPKTAKVYRDSDGKCFERIEMKYKKI